MKKVYFLKKGSDMKEAADKICSLFSDSISSENKVALKLHFGERNLDTSLNPKFVKRIFENILKKTSDVSLVETTVLYKGERSLASTHLKLARDKGFDFAPIDIVDGEKGDKEARVIINNENSSLKEIKIGAGIQKYDTLLVLSHFTGHLISGIGGAIKNVGMGLADKAGKLEMHQAFNLEIDKSLCTGCTSCIKDCPASAISLKDGKAEIDFEKCIGCGKCVSVCPYSAIKVPLLNAPSKVLQEKMAEYASGILQAKKAFYINVLTGITQRCDCVNFHQDPIMEDIGILFSEDIVSIDKASLDLAGKERFTSPEIDPAWQVEKAFSLGMGEKEYELIEV